MDGKKEDHSAEMKRANGNQKYLENERQAVETTE